MARSTVQASHDDPWVEETPWTFKRARRAPVFESLLNEAWSALKKTVPARSQKEMEIDVSDLVLPRTAPRTRASSSPVLGLEVEDVSLALLPEYNDGPFEEPSGIRSYPDLAMVPTRPQRPARGVRLVTALLKGNKVR